MKVGDTKGVGQVESVQPAKPATSVTKADKVTVDEARAREVAIEVARRTAGADQAALVAQVVNQVKQGTYKPNPQQIAERILQSAELEARLRALLKR